jgi:hydroxyacylglutathione hydrolase
MLFNQFEAKGLSHFSYAIGSREEGEVMIIDPERDIKTYIAYAAENRVKIKYILETHIHADYASGAHELAHKTGAELLLSGYDKGEKYAYSFPHKELKEGDEIRTGRIRLKVLHTPGHTPEHISFLAYDEERSKEEPFILFSGDFLFIGSVGRPDLLGEDDKTPLAKAIYKALHEKLKGLPDGLEIYPAHGAGSLCGAGMSNSQSSTLGFEREVNPYLQEMSEEEFVKKLLGSAPPFPEYYLKMKVLNSKGAPSAETALKPEPMDSAKFSEIVGTDAVVLDVRHPLAFGGGHIEGSLNIGMPDQIGFWAAWFVPYEKPIYLVLDDEEKLRDYTRALVRVGLDNVKGYLKPGFGNWANRGNDFLDLPQASVHMLNDFMDIGEKVTIVDVRSESEWNEGHIKGAKHLYLGELPKHVKKIAGKEDAVFCICGGGSRSSVAGSYLMMHGYENVYNVYGGMTAWKNAQLPVTTK